MSFLATVIIMFNAFYSLLLWTKANNFIPKRSNAKKFEMEMDKNEKRTKMQILLLIHCMNLTRKL